MAQQPTTLPTITVTPPTVTGATLERAPVRAPASTPAAPTTPAAAPPLENGGDTAAGVPVDQIGTQVTVITSSDIRRQQTQSVSEIIRGLPGVQVSSSGSVGGLTQIRIRGAEGRHTRVMIDGIEANTTTNGEFDFSNLSTEDIERIEIIRGPMSALYGQGALGGTINIITRGHRGPARADMRVEGGSFGTKDVAARVAAGNQNGFVALSGQFRRIEGFNVAPEGNENDGTRLASFGLRAGLNLSPTARLDLTLRHTDKRAEYDDFGTVSRSPFLTADEANNVLRDKTTLAGVTLAWDALGGALTQEVRGTYARSAAVNRLESLLPGQFGAAVGTINNTSDSGDRLTGSYAATYRMTMPAIGLQHAITGLVDARRETYTPFSDYAGGFAGDGLQRQRQQVGVGAEWRGTFNDRLSLTAGARRDANDSFADATTWRASLSYAWREIGLRPHASIGKAVKQPGFGDQFGPNTNVYQSNPNLKPEESRGYDVGVEWTTWGGRALFDVTYFAHDLTDKITGYGGFDSVTSRSFTTNAAGVSERRGAELSARFALSPQISFGLAYTYTDARQPNGSPEVRRAPHSGRGDLRWTSLDGKATASVVATYNGAMPEIAYGPGYVRLPNVALDPYWLVGIAGSYKLQPNVELYGRIENALDTKYQEVRGYQTGGIAAYVGLKVALEAQK
jgi:vitamin B12 transporter